MSEEVSYYLQQLRQSSNDDAYFGLLELDNSTIPTLIEAYHQETNIAIKAILIEIIWKHETYNSLDFLRTALQHDSDLVWKTALDGLVAVGRLKGIAILHDEKKRLSANADKAKTRLIWIDEAIAQIKSSK